MTDMTDSTTTETFGETLQSIDYPMVELDLYNGQDLKDAMTVQAAGYQELQMAW